MTAHEALEALKLAPRTNEPSKVNPKFTQKQMVENAVVSIGKLLYSRSNLQPDESRMICAIVQDWPDPVALHFTYGKDGKIYVAYNRDELALRQTPKREKTAAEKLAEKYARDQDDEYLRFIREQLIFQHPSAQQSIDWFDSQKKPLLSMPKPTVIQLNKSPAPVVPEKKQPPPPEPPKQEEKPDVKSPTFVLKRPKL